MIPKVGLVITPKVGLVLIPRVGLVIKPKVGLVLILKDVLNVIPKVGLVRVSEIDLKYVYCNKYLKERFYIMSNLLIITRQISIKILSKQDRLSAPIFNAIFRISFKTSRTYKIYIK